MTSMIIFSNVTVGAQIIGYYSSWKVYSTCKIEEINASLFTILIYAFAHIHDNGTLKPLDDWADIKKEGYKKFNALKLQNPRLKTLLGIGGWSDGSEKYSNMVSTGARRKVFIKSVLDYMDTYGFDGIDLDWEYPTKRGGKPEDKENLSLLLKELRLEFDRRNFMLTMAVIAGESSIDQCYEVTELSKYLDYINLMMYDMHSTAGGRTGQNAPLFSDDRYNVDYCTRAWLRKGAIASKTILGIPLYGRSFTLSDKNQHGIGAPSTGPGMAGPHSKANGTMYYYEVLELQKLGWVREWSKEQLVPFTYYKNQWIGYDDIKSVRKKVKFAKVLQLAGVMLWSLDMDDPRGKAGTKFPLINAINSEYLK